MSPKWRVVHSSQEASDELVSLFENEEVKREIALLLKMLSEEDDPRTPENDRILKVAEIEHDAPGWFRLKVTRFNIHIQ
jgi:hypothetical protein